MRPIALRGRPIADGKIPLVCAPLVARTRQALRDEADTVMRAGPDVVEWRADFYQDIAKTAFVIETARALRAILGNTPLLFTKRSLREGGEPGDLSEDAVADLHGAVCEAGCTDLVDFEMGNTPALVHRVREATARHGVALVLSYHNFSETPPLAALNGRFAHAQQLGADVAKVAVMPRTLDDVLVLLAATLQSSQALRIPLISMSMGAYGSLTRMFGWMFGSALTFGIGASGSAPGQLPIDELNAVIAITRRATGGR